MDFLGPDPESRHGSAGSAQIPDGGAAGAPAGLWYTGASPLEDVVGPDGVSGDDGRDRRSDAPAGEEGPAWLGGEVIESGPERPRSESGVQHMAAGARRWWRSTAMAGPWRRRVVAATAALAAAAAIVGLRAGAPAPTAEQPAAAGTQAPVIIYGRARMQPPPFDRLPGRTPIPLPSPLGRPAEAVRGALPATGPTPGERSARAAAELVLGRYCRYPRAYYVQVEDTGDWDQVRATVLRQAYAGSRRLTTLQLRWTGRSYSWQGWPAELARCS